MTEGKIVSWIKSEGDVLSKGDSVVVVESDKADMETEEEISEAKAKAQSARTSSKLEKPAPSPPSSAPAPPPTPPPPKPAPVVDGPRKIVATPYAKKLAKQHKINLDSLSGTGPFGRITPADVEKAAGIVSPKKTAAAVAADAAPSGPVAMPTKAAGNGGIYVEIPGSSVVPFTTMQAAVAKNMVESLSVPTFRVGYPVLTDALDALYEKVKPKGVTMTALLAKAAAMALAHHPVVNSTCKDGKSFTYNSSINIAVAVAINGGLITPVLQDADKLDLYLLSQKWKELVEKARAKQLQPREYNSGTFTLSNLGMFGVDRFDAILPPGQGAIMAVGASKPSVVADANGFFSVKNKMMVNVTADHRIIYGADLAAFLQTFSKIIQEPEGLTM
ncbi:hypothetical protein Dimus_014725 [Dionaea muscipula]